MAQIALLYLVTAVIFLGLDYLGIRFIVRPVFDRHVGHLLAEPLRLAPAAVFYLAYVAGLVWLVSAAALREQAPLQALVGGLVLGAVAYGTYEFTNLATLADWSWEQVVTDGLWGTALTGFSAWAGVALLSQRVA